LDCPTFQLPVESGDLVSSVTLCLRPVMNVHEWQQEAAIVPNFGGTGSLAVDIFVISMKTFLSMTQMTTFGQLQQFGLLLSPPQGSIVHFISHQWLGDTHPDPNGVHLRRMQKVFSEIVAGHADQLFSETDWLLVSTGATRAVDMLAAGWGGAGPRLGLKAFTSEEFGREVDRSFVWLDYTCIPQVADVADTHHESQAARAASMSELEEVQGEAIGNIAAYVERANYFWILAPTALHSGTGQICDFSTWRERGWCRVEEWANLLSKRDRMPFLVTEKSQLLLVPTFDFLMSRCGRPEQAAIHGEFSCCRLNHLRTCHNGQLVQIPCDRTRVDGILELMWEEKVQSFAQSGNSIMLAPYLCGITAVRGEGLGRHTLEEVQRLFLVDNLEELDQWGRYPLTYMPALMVENGSEIVKQVIDMYPYQLLHRDPDGLTALVAAMSNSDPRVAEILVEAGIKLEGQVYLNQRSNTGLTPLHIASAYGYLGNMHVLLRHRADVNAQLTDLGWTPLMLAAQGSSVAACELLLLEGASANIAAKDGQTAIHLACDPVNLFGNTTRQQLIEIVKLLLGYRANPDRRDRQGRSPADMAMLSGFDSMLLMLTERQVATGDPLLVENATCCTVTCLGGGTAAWWRGHF